MGKFIKLPYLAFVLGAFLLTSCGKDDDTTTEPVPDPTNPSTQKCIVTRLNSTDGTNNQETIFEYNGQRQVTKTTFKNNGVIDTEHQVIEYNSGGRVSKSTTMNGTTITRYTTYTYNADGLLTRQESFDSQTSGSPIALTYIQTYEYNGNKKLTKVNGYNGATPNVVQGYSLFTYPSGNTATKQYYYSQTSGATPTLESTVNYTFDDKKSPQQLLGVLLDDEYISDHNIIRVEEIIASGGTPDVRTIVYEYNAENFPTKGTINYNGSASFTLNLTYNCN